MKTNIKKALIVSVVILAISCKDKVQEVILNTPKEIAMIDNFTIHEAKSINNLSLFVITGKEANKGKIYSTLSEKMEKKQVVVNETGSVNQLSIDNNSNDYVFIHSGDIVKGGKQDRTISYDVIIPPNAKKVKLESFCVEQGRWQQRTGEAVTSFNSNSKMLSSRDLKLAAKHEKNQGNVWSKVSEQKAYLNQKLSAKNGYAVNVSDNESNTSLQLALESKELKKAKEAFYKELKDAITTTDALGYAYTINGEIYAVEVYNNQQLFKDLWEKILESIIVEAISKEGEKTSSEKTEKDVLAYMKAVKLDAKKTNKKLNKTTNFKTLENKDGNIVFVTEDLKKKTWAHKSYMKVDSLTKPSKIANSMLQRININ